MKRQEKPADILVIRTQQGLYNSIKPKQTIAIRNKIDEILRNEPRIKTVILGSDFNDLGNSDALSKLLLPEKLGEMTFYHSFAFDPPITRSDGLTADHILYHFKDGKVRLTEMYFVPLDLPTHLPLAIGLKVFRDDKPNPILYMIGKLRSLQLLLHPSFFCRKKKSTKGH